MTLKPEKIHTIVETPELITFCDYLQKQSWVAVDTEFIREKTYRPQLCLIQVATTERVVCIDPLTLENIEPLLDVLFNRNILKIFHAAGQDLEIFYWLKKLIPGPIFDTQLAAPLLGYQEQIGYSNLVKAILDVDLAKAHSRADWTRRPLPDPQLRYAADDVLYLARIYPLMRDELTKKNRLLWLDNDFQALENPLIYEPPVSDMWLRVRGIQRYKGQTLSIIQKIAEWREITAKEQNLPRRWLMKDEMLIDIAKQVPTSLEDLSHMRGISEGMLRRHGDILLQIVANASSMNPQPMPAFNKKTKLKPMQEAIVDLLSTLVKIRSQELSINPMLLAPRKELEKLILQPGQSLLIQGWRKELIGNQLLEALDGKIRLYIEAQQVKLERD